MATAGGTRVSLVGARAKGRASPARLSVSKGWGRPCGLRAGAREALRGVDLLTGNQELFPNALVWRAFSDLCSNDVAVESRIKGGAVGPRGWLGMKGQCEFILRL